MAFHEMQQQVARKRNNLQQIQAQHALTAVDQRRTVMYQVQQPLDINQPGPSGIVTRKQSTAQPVTLPGHLEGYQRDFNLQFLGPQGTWAQEMEEQQSTECSESTSSEDPAIQLEVSTDADVNVNTGPVYQPVSPAIVVTQVPHATSTTTHSNVVNGAIPVPTSSNIPAYQTMQGYVKGSDSSPPQLSKAHMKKKARHAKEKKVAELFGPDA
jgi:hypothetical protein